MAPPSTLAHPKVGWGDDRKSPSTKVRRKTAEDHVSIVLSPKLAQEDVDILNQLSQKELKMLRQVNATNWMDYSFGGAAARPLDQLSITGMSLVCNPGAFWLRRTIWLVIIICLLVWLCFQLKLCVDRFSTGGTTRAWTLKNPHKIPLPAITVCHGSKFKKSVVLRHQKNGSDWQQWHTKGYNTLDWNSFTDLHTFYGEAAYTWSDMVFYCTVKKQPCGQIGSLQSRSTLLNGLCTTFVSNSTVKKRLVSGQIIVVFSENESLGKYEHSGWKIFLHPADVEFSDYVFFTGQLTSVTVYPNRRHELKLKRQITSRLPTTSKDACSTAPDAAQRYLTCLDDCLISSTADRHREAEASSSLPLCRIPWMPAGSLPSSALSCRSYEELAYSSDDTHNGVSEDDFVAFASQCNCTRSCRLDRYQQQQHEKWNIDETSIYLKYPSVLGKTIGVLKIWLTDVEEYILEQPAYGFESFVAEVGGNLGLMLGGSLLTFVEIIDCVIAGCLHRRSRRVRN